MTDSHPGRTVLFAASYVAMNLGFSAVYKVTKDVNAGPLSRAKYNDLTEESRKDLTFSMCVWSRLFGGCWRKGFRDIGNHFGHR